MLKIKRILSVISLLLALFLVEGMGVWQYRNSAPYLYEKALEKADVCYAEGKWQEAYEAYREALLYEKGDEKILRRAVLSNLERVKESENQRHIIQTYYEIFTRYADLFQEAELSDWYFECVDVYLDLDAPMGAVSLLENGMEVFSETETVKKMKEKKRDILAHTKAKSKTGYYGIFIGDYKLMKLSHLEYDEEGKEIFQLHYGYHGEKKSWEYISYDKNGNKVYSEIWYTEGNEAQKYYEEYLSYDKNGNLLNDMTYSLSQIYTEWIYRYDKDGNEIL